MSLLILQKGLQDTVQDVGRTGYAQQGINANGAMDATAMQLANILVGNAHNSAVLEMHFPAATIQFTQAAIIALAGANFLAEANHVNLPNYRPICMPAGSVLRFTKPVFGQRVYLAVHGGFNIDTVFESRSTNLIGGFGGYNGRALQPGDKLDFMVQIKTVYTNIQMANWFIKAPTNSAYVRVMPGPEWPIFSKLLQPIFNGAPLVVDNQSNRMGVIVFFEKGLVVPLYNMVSSAVASGTVQLLPSGKLVVLMADTQTVGGYPRVLQVAAADLSILAQASPGNTIHFAPISITEAATAFNQLQYFIADIANQTKYKVAQFIQAMQAQ